MQAHLVGASTVVEEVGEAVVEALEGVEEEALEEVVEADGGRQVFTFFGTKWPRALHLPPSDEGTN